MQPEDLTHKFVAVLNKHSLPSPSGERRKIPVGNLMNALGHMAAGLGGSADNSNQIG